MSVSSSDSDDPADTLSSDVDSCSDVDSSSDSISSKHLVSRSSIPSSVSLSRPPLSLNGSALLRKVLGNRERKGMGTQNGSGGQVVRVSLLGVLTVEGEEDCVPLLRRQFKLPTAGPLSELDIQLSKTKTLGPMRRWDNGLGGGAFKRMEVQQINIVADEGKQVDMPVVVDKNDYTGVEPLLLWESTDVDNPDKPKPIVVEMFLCKFLRPHQRDGVRFMAECVTGQRDFEGFGAILADDMGLGKTLQSITLLYTLLTQGMGDGPLVKRAVIVCPTSLVSNWANEIKKWCGSRIKCVALSESSREKAIMGIADFLSPRREYPVLIVSYETFRLHVEKFDTESSCDFLICDEAHRLKNAETLTYTALANLPCKRRILLSGTPMQNNLEEFFAMVDLINPGVLGDEKHFRRVYQSPILAGREPDATEKERELCNERSIQLSGFVNKFVLRRTNNLLSKHLPPKVIEIVCCRPSPLQITLYDHFLKSKAVKQLIADSAENAERGSGGGVQVLPLITALKKLCNHPRLVYEEAKASGKKSSGIFEGILDYFPDNYNRRTQHELDPTLSGKFCVLDKLLCTVRKTTDDRFVLISNYTQTLDLFADLCRIRNWPFVRLDGSTAVKKRQKLVDQLTDRTHDTYIFLLSSKAGGCGLNLIGANRLVLFDPDWNPAVDKQAAARVWRDGQKRRCYIYRFLTTGTIEEKVYQRQLSKEGLQNVIGSGTADQTDVSSEDLRDLFSLLHNTVSDTHDTLNCECLTKPPDADDQVKEDNPKVALPASKEQVGEPKEEDLENWAHHSSIRSVDDECMRISHPAGMNSEEDFLSFLFTCHVRGELAIETPNTETNASAKSKLSSRQLASLSNKTNLASGLKPFVSPTKPTSLTTLKAAKPIEKVALPAVKVDAVKVEVPKKEVIKAETVVLKDVLPQTEACNVTKFESVVVPLDESKGRPTRERKPLKNATESDKDPKMTRNKTPVKTGAKERVARSRNKEALAAEINEDDDVSSDQMNMLVDLPKRSSPRKKNAIVDDDEVPESLNSSDALIPVSSTHGVIQNDLALISKSDVLKKRTSFEMQNGENERLPEESTKRQIVPTPPSSLPNLFSQVSIVSPLSEQENVSLGALEIPVHSSLFSLPVDPMFLLSQKGATGLGSRLKKKRPAGGGEQILINAD